ncbi:MAG: GNAT family N-acyltransferase [Ketobacter sp.]
MMLHKPANTHNPIDIHNRPRFFAEFITAKEEIREAQKMRYEVFCEEYKVVLPVHNTWNGHPIDVDDLDDYCLHLVVRNQANLEIIGYTRVLTCELAARFGRYYSSHEFHIDNIINRPGRFLEIGRTCIHPDFRNGATIAVLWAHLAKFMQENEFRYLFGCASISLEDSGKNLAKIMPVLREKFWAKSEYSVQPKMPINPLPDPSLLIEEQLNTAHHAAKPAIPPLLKAYTRMGALICGEACLDPEFNVADLFVLLDIKNVSDRYAKHFLRTEEAA